MTLRQCSARLCFVAPSSARDKLYNIPGLKYKYFRYFRIRTEDAKNIEAIMNGSKVGIAMWTVESIPLFRDHISPEGRISKHRAGEKKAEKEGTNHGWMCLV